MSLTVGELKKKLNQFDDDIEVFCKPSTSVGNTGEVYYVWQDTYMFFGKELPGVVLSDSEPPPDAIPASEATNK